MAQQCLGNKYDQIQLKVKNIPIVSVLLGTTVFKKSLTPIWSNSIEGRKSHIASLK